MEPATLIGIGALIASAIAVVLNLWTAYRNKRKAEIQSSAAVVEAENQMRLGSVQAAQKVIDMYGAALAELKARVQFLEQRVQELEHENHTLRSQQGFDKDVKVNDNSRVEWH